MKCSKAGIHRKTHRIPEIRFEDQRLTSFSGLVVYQTLLSRISTPLEHLSVLKALIENWQRWRCINRKYRLLETDWKLGTQDQRYRFVFVRSQNRKQHKGAVQLDLSIPCEYGYDFKVIVTNKCVSAKRALVFHNRQGVQESIFAEFKSQMQIDYVPDRTGVGNQTFALTAVLAHNLNREMQIICFEKERNSTEMRTLLWNFEQLCTVRCKLIQRAGWLTRPQR